MDMSIMHENPLQPLLPNMTWLRCGGTKCHKGLSPTTSWSKCEPQMQNIDVPVWLVIRLGKCLKLLKIYEANIQSLKLSQS